jgi:hypothetical protein
MAEISGGTGHQRREQVLDLVAGQADQPGWWWVAGAVGGREHHEEGVGDHSQGGPAVPGAPAADLVLVQAAKALAGLEALFDGPAAPGDPHQGGQEHGAGCPAAVESQLAGGAVASDQQPVLAGLAARMGGAVVQADKRPVVQAVGLDARRQDLVAARTRTINRLHRLLMDLVPGGARRNLTAKRAAGLLAAVTPAGAPAVTRWQLATDLVADVRELEQRIAAVEARIKTAVAQANTSLVELLGVGPVLAATFLGEVGDVGRFPSRHHFAAHTGTAPLEASSGQVVRHRLSRAGDRKLNHALYMMAMVQVRRPSAGQAYYQRKLAEGKSPKEALRCLKRRLSDAVYRCLLADQHH